MFAIVRKHAGSIRGTGGGGVGKGISFTMLI